MHPVDDTAHALPAFDLDDPLLPDRVSARALSSGGFPYDKQIDRGKYETERRAPDCELTRARNKRGDIGAPAIVEKMLRDFCRFVAFSRVGWLGWRTDGGRYAAENQAPVGPQTHSRQSA